MEDGSFLRMNLKMTHKSACPGEPDPTSKFWDPLITGNTSVVNYNNKTANIKGQN